MKTSSNQPPVTNYEEGMNRLLSWIENVVSRMPQPFIEAHARRASSLAMSPRNTGPLFNFMTFVDDDMPQEQFDDIVTATLATFSKVMTDPSTWLDPSIVKSGPPMSSASSGFKFTTGDFEAFGHIGDVPDHVHQALHNLKDRRQLLRSRLTGDPNVTTTIVAFAEAVEQAIKGATKGKGFIQSYYDFCYDEGLIKVKPVVDPSTDFYIVPQNLINANKKQRLGGDPLNSEFTGAIPANIILSLYRVGKFVITYGPIIIDTLKFIFDSLPPKDVAAKLDPYATYNANNYGKFFQLMAAKCKEAGITGADSAIANIATSIKATMSAYHVGDQANSIYDAWRLLYMNASLANIVKSVTLSMMKGIAFLYKDINPEQTEVQAMFTPVNDIPLQNLIGVLWDPVLIMDDDIAWQDFKDYYLVASRLDPKIASALKGKQIYDFERAFKLGSKAFITDTKVNDAWKDVAKRYVKSMYLVNIKLYGDLIISALKASFAFTTKLAQVAPGVTVNDVYPGNSVSKFTPWNKNSLNATINSAASIYKKKSSPKKTVNPTATNSNQVNDVNVSDVNVSDDDNNVNVNVNNGGSESGTILVTPYETIFGAGSLINPDGSITTYNKLYQFGDAINKARKEARLYLSLPTPNPSLTGDMFPLTGGLFSGILKVGKNLLSKTKLGKRIIDKVQSIGSKIPILRNLIAKKPEDVKALADKSVADESKATESIVSSAGTLPIDPSQIMALVSNIQMISDVVQGTDKKIDQCLDIINKLQFGQISSNRSVLDDGELVSSRNGEVAVDSPISAIDAMAAATGVAFPSYEGIGDVSLWQIIP